ncbi:MAG TPA: hypothetical protein VLD39_13850, partial [Gammaproteobacteria bacterium]|nr:hypothetical protein [Gammaproteobacteria bacterium]
MRLLTRKALARRTFLRGVGATIALPFLDAMLPAGGSVARAQIPTAPRRFLGIFVPHGAAPGFWVPDSTAPGFEFPFVYEPLAPYRRHVT